MKPIILHISNDYPDSLVPQKTRAVLNLVEGTPQFSHVVYSLNRANAFSGLSAISFGEDRTAISYGALPKGIFWRSRLKSVASWIIADLKAKRIQPSIVEAHKLTIEGIIGLEIARAFSCPLVCDIQGYTDINMLAKKPSFHDDYREIANVSAAIFPYAPWPLDAFEEKIGLKREKCHMLPVISTLDTMSAAPFIATPKLLSVFHLDGWKNKNFKGMILAVKALREQGKDITLDVYGAGSPKTMLILQGLINRHSLQKHISLMGSVENGKMPEIMKKYVGFVMPSYSESYGLVYVEALFSGVPILLNTKRGVSGYFDLTQVGYGCDPSNVEDIARGMQILIDNQKPLKENIAQMQKRGVFDFMRKHAILKTYTSVMETVLAGKK